MQSPLAFVAFSDAELQWLIGALQDARYSLPWQPLSLQAHDGAWILRLQGPLALYHEIVVARPSIIPASDAAAPDDRLTRFMRDACKPWPSATTASSPSHQPPRPEGDAATGLPGAVFRSARAKNGRFAGADWRSHSFALQDLRGADFSAADLRGADFHGANLQGASFRQARFGLAQPDTGLARWRLPAYRLLLDYRRFLALGAAALLIIVFALGWALQAGYAGASLCGLIWVVGMLLLDQKQVAWRQKLVNGGTRFDGANLQQADFSGAQIGLVNFEMARLQHVCWQGATREMPLHFSDPLLRQPGVLALLCGQRERQDFSGLDLSAQHLAGLDLSGLDLTATHLQAADLRGCNLQGAHLSGANLCGADLSRTNVSGASLSGWQIDQQTVLAQMTCDYWLGLDWRGVQWRGVSPGIGSSLQDQSGPMPQRWPPEPDSLRPGEFAHLIAPVTNGVRFLAQDLHACQTLLDLIIDLAQALPLRVTRILFDSSPAVPCVLPSVEHAAVASLNQSLPVPKSYGYQIEVLIENGVNADEICRRVWESWRIGMDSDSDFTPADRLIACLGVLAHVDAGPLPES